MQRALIQFAVPKNYNKVKKALIKAHREDLIGNGKECLIGFAPGKTGYQGKNKNNKSKVNDSSKKSALSKNNSGRTSNRSSKTSVSRPSKNSFKRSSGKRRTSH